MMQEITAARYIGRIAEYVGELEVGDVGFDGYSNIAVYNGSAIVFHRSDMVRKPDLLAACSAIDNAYLDTHTTGRHVDPGVPPVTDENVLMQVRKDAHDFWNGVVSEDDDDDARDDLFYPVSVPHFEDWSLNIHALTCYSEVTFVKLGSMRCQLALKPLEHPGGLRVGDHMIARDNYLGATPRIDLGASDGTFGCIELPDDFPSPDMTFLGLTRHPRVAEASPKGDLTWVERIDVVCVEKVFPVIMRNVTVRKDNHHLTVYYNT